MKFITENWFVIVALAAVGIYIPVWFYYDPFKYQYGKHASAMV